MPQPRNRPFVVTAVLTGFVFSVVSTTLTPHVALVPVAPDLESGSRFSVLPIFLFEAVAVMGVDNLMRQWRGVHRRHSVSLRPVMAVAALVAVLAASWLADFRYASFRSTASWNWAPIAARWQHDCEHSTSGEIVEKTSAYLETLPCQRMRP
jgi:hypothetical protein